jgi:hypothetical protein
VIHTVFLVNLESSLLSHLVQRLVDGSARCFSPLAATGCPRQADHVAGVHSATTCGVPYSQSGLALEPRFLAPPAANLYMLRVALPMAINALHADPHTRQDSAILAPTVRGLITPCGPT